MPEPPFLEVRDLKKHFPIRGGVLSKIVGYVYAVDGVSFTVGRGETFGIVGESGCGKTTVGRCILRLIEPTSGQIFFEGRDITKLERGELRRLRRRMQIVFQDPYASLNPRMTVKDIVGEPLKINKIAKGQGLEGMVLDLLYKVGLTKDHLHRFPHEFSGGQRQRIGMARALALNPSLVILDEPTSSLDVSVQAQTLNILKDLQRKLDLTYIFISHNLSVIKHMCDRVGVMYLGKIVELASKSDLFKEPLHPYTKALLSAIPIPNPEAKRERLILAGDVPDPTSPPSGCRFHPRCPFVMPICSEVEPELVEIKKAHWVACHLYHS